MFMQDWRIRNWRVRETRLLLSAVTIWLICYMAYTLVMPLSHAHLQVHKAYTAGSNGRQWKNTYSLTPATHKDRVCGVRSQRGGLLACLAAAGVYKEQCDACIECDLTARHARDDSALLEIVTAPYA